ncbi:hypothetical protein QAD02_016610 [Eretmocerus hayati]|uniref:Uncharacterized protein n=1 Tax=Eretmocerus hayati TaxID=131215 RepID=A0ACC2PCL2_9HYME|nr:hypothetical protein QAD02_016610 [Eretmocerus hayati]
MAHGVSDVLAEQHHQNSHKMQPHRALHALRKAGSGGPGGAAGAIGCRRMFAPAFKIKVLDSYRNDIDCRGYPPSTPLTPPGYLHHQHQQSLYFQHHLQPASSPDGSEVSCGYLHPVKRELISMDLDEEEALRRGSLSPPPSSSAASSDSETDQQQYTSDLARRRSFSLRFKLDVLDAFHRDGGVGGNQRATARKFGINRRQVQKWLGQEGELRGVVELNRQRLGGAPMLPGDHDDLLVGNHHHQQKHTSPVDLSRPDYADSSLTPPYSAPGCSLSCCQDNFYCYSPPEIQRCTQSCCTSSFVTTTPPMSTTTQPTLPSPDVQVDDAEQDIPLCLVKPKVPSAPASPQQQSSRKDAILFKPYLDNPEVCNLNERSTPEKTSHETSLSWSSTPSPQHHLQTPYFDYPPIRSAFVRYPASVRY